MHREEQVVQAAAGLVEAWPSLGASVFTHRTLSLGPDDQELPAICLNNGPDEPGSEQGVDNLAYVDSVSTLVFTLYAQGDDQETVASELDRLRVLVHKAMLQSPRTLGLSFVMGVWYAGASEPEFSNDGSPLAGRRDCTYRIPYRMSLTDPEN